MLRNITTLLDRTESFLIQLSRRNLITSATFNRVLQQKKPNKNVENLQFVRNRKKPWDAIAGTKLHNVNKRVELDVEEYKEMSDRFRIYRTMMKSILNEFKKENEKHWSMISSFLNLNPANPERENFIKKINDDWNNKSAELRKGFEVEEVAAKEKDYQDLSKVLEDAQNDRMEKAKILLEQLKVKRSSFIDLSRLDEAIEESLNKRGCFNFFIDKEGRRFGENLDGTVTEIDAHGNLIVKNESETGNLPENEVTEAVDVEAEMVPEDDNYHGISQGGYFPNSDPAGKEK